MEISSGDMHLRLSQQLDSILNLMQTQIRRATNSPTTNDRVTPEVKNIVGKLTLRENTFETRTSPYQQGPRDPPDVSLMRQT